MSRPVRAAIKHLFRAVRTPPARLRKALRAMIHEDPNQGRPQAGPVEKTKPEGEGADA